MLGQRTRMGQLEMDLSWNVQWLRVPNLVGRALDQIVILSWRQRSHKGQPDVILFRNFLSNNYQIWSIYSWGKRSIRGQLHPSFRDSVLFKPFIILTLKIPHALMDFNQIWVINATWKPFIWWQGHRSHIKIKGCLRSRFKIG